MMKYLYYLLSVAVAVSAHAVHTHDHDPTPLHAIAHIEGKNVRGTIKFAKIEDNKVHITGEITGMPPGIYGFHVHEYGDTSNDCKSAGAHFNPNKKEHGHPHDDNRHVGDLGNVSFDENGVSRIEMIDHIISLEGSNNIIGRAVVLHEGPDDFGRTDHPDSKKTGNAGGRVACGVIAIAP